MPHRLAKGRRRGTPLAYPLPLLRVEREVRLYIPQTRFVDPAPPSHFSWQQVAAPPAGVAERPLGSIVSHQHAGRRPPSEIADVIADQRLTERNSRITGAAHDNPPSGE